MTAYETIQVASMCAMVLVWFGVEIGLILGARK